MNTNTKTRSRTVTNTEALSSRSMVKIKDNRAGSKRDAQDMNKPELNIGCASCLRLFTTRAEVTHHVSSNHGAENLLSLFFNNTDEFSKWKREVERTVIVKYVHDDAATLGHALYDNAANIYSCNARTSPKATPMKTPLPGVSKYYCPSIMIVQWYTTAVHVLYYRAHYGHSCPMYTLHDRYKNNVTSNLIYTQWHNKFLESPDISVLTKFNILMNAIANGAEVISEENLRMLHGKAIEFMLDMKRPRQDRQEKRPRQDKEENLRTYVGKKVKKTGHLEAELLMMNKSRIFRPKLNDKVPEKQTVVMPKPLKSGHAFCLNDIESELNEELDDNSLDTDVDIPEIKEENDLDIEEHDLAEIVFKKAAPKMQSAKNKKLKPQKPTKTPEVQQEPPEVQKETPKVQKEPPEVQKEPPTEPIKPWINNSPSSFNDTYKSFLEQTIQTPFKEDLGKRKKHEPPSLLKQREQAIQTPFKEELVKRKKHEPPSLLKQREQTIQTPFKEELGKRKKHEPPSPLKQREQTIQTPFKEELGKRKKYEPPSLLKQREQTIQTPFKEELGKRKKHEPPSLLKQREQTIQTPFKEELGKRKKHEPPSILKQRKIKTKLDIAPVTQPKKILRKREKRPATKRSSSSSGSEEVKVKVEQYEVMEQENDCNILILKF